MYKVKNKSVKVITIGKTDILPDQIVEIKDSYRTHPVIQLFIKKKFLVEIPANVSDEETETVEDLAKRIKKMKKTEVFEKLKELNLEFDENEKVDVLRTRLIEAMA